jgi:hypothetical protein
MNDLKYPVPALVYELIAHLKMMKTFIGLQFHRQTDSRKL